MNKWTRGVLVISGVLIVTARSAHAVTYQASLEVTSIRVADGGEVFVGFNQQPVGTCDAYGEYVTFDSSVAGSDSLLSGLYVAYSTGKTIDIWYDDSTAPGTNQNNGCSTATMAALRQIRLK